MSIKTTPEEWATMQDRVAQWAENATPEQKQKIVDAAQQALSMAESLGKAFSSAMVRDGGHLAQKLSLRVDLPANAAPMLDACIQYGKAAAAVMESLDALKQHPDIAASPYIAAFVARLCDELGQSFEPFDVLASHQNEKEQPKRRAKALKAVNSRKDRKAAPELKAFVMQLYHQGPFAGGPWKDLPTAARAIESKVNAKASEIGCPRKKTKFSYQSVQRWIEEGLASTE
ncbi:hypothetical protein [Candidatus Igneacidithiobacillus taiwanensis]|uniref:hypothetical protein n=1 Tax=Candidatus Igneacidithiobacillus taiwanensis TaxID=1945924 RepID=UPI00289E3B95|nr:hypothetical protein [Candidatus Igneacidithiobacillus taiwanensis]